MRGVQNNKSSRDHFEKWWFIYTSLKIKFNNHAIKKYVKNAEGPKLITMKTIDDETTHCNQITSYLHTNETNLVRLTTGTDTINEHYRNIQHLLELKTQNNTTRTR